MSMAISMWKLPGFTDQPQKTPATILKEKKDLSSNKAGEALRITNIDKVRVMDVNQILAHGVLSAYPLFDGDIRAPLYTVSRPNSWRFRLFLERCPALVKLLRDGCVSRRVNNVYACCWVSASYALPFL